MMISMLLATGVGNARLRGPSKLPESVDDVRKDARLVETFSRMTTMPGTLEERFKKSAASSRPSMKQITYRRPAARNDKELLRREIVDAKSGV